MKFIHIQTQADTTWHINHQMADSHFILQVYDGSKIVTPKSVTVVNENIAAIKFKTKTTGKALLIF